MRGCSFFARPSGSSESAHVGQVLPARVSIAFIRRSGWDKYSHGGNTFSDRLSVREMRRAIISRRTSEIDAEQEASGRRGCGCRHDPRARPGHVGRRVPQDVRNRPSHPGLRALS